MNVLFTGGSSPLGARVLRALLEHEDLQVWATVNRREIPFTHPRLKTIKLDLLRVSAVKLPGPLDRVIHFAAVTHAGDPQLYWQINHDATIGLANAALERGCKSFVYISSRCASDECGAYGGSKLAAEEKLRTMSFASLLIVRPAEIYGGGGTEGIDQMLRLADKWHVVPLLFGDRRLRFSPLIIDDFVRQITDVIESHSNGEEIVEMCGPEDLSSSSLAMRIARRYHALPIPLWWPGLELSLRLLQKLGVSLVKEDQLARATGRKTCYRSADNNLKGFLQ